jgi:hypothetical protein
MRSIPLSLLALSLTALVGCKAVDAMDNTETMKQDLASMKETTNGMSGTTQVMSCDMTDLKRAAYKGAGVELVAKPENTREFTPPQANMLAGAKLIAENMTNEELIEYMYARLKEINKTVPDESKYDRRLLGGYVPEYVAEFNRAKQVQAVILQAIASQIPQQEIVANPKCPDVTVTASLPVLIREQLEGGGGRYSDTMYTILMLRAMFLNSFYIDAGVFSTTMDNMGKLEKANTYISNLDFIASLPYVDKIQFTLEGTAFLPPVSAPQLQAGDADYAAKCQVTTPDPACLPTLGEVPNLDATMDPDMAKPWWKKLVKKIDREMPDSYKGSSSPYAREVAEIRANAERNALDGRGGK